MPPVNSSAPLRHPSHRSLRQKTPSPSFVDRWRDKMRSDLAARVKSARERAVIDARGGDDEVNVVVSDFIRLFVLSTANSYRL